MKKLTKLFAVTFLFTVLLCQNVQAAGVKYATVDIQKVVTSSKQVNALKA